MRILTVAVLLIAFAIASKAANDGPWCYRDFGGLQYTNCYYYSVRECLIAAGIRGGVCEPNHDAASESRKRTNLRRDYSRPARVHPA
jgi:hypothetical protein